MYGSTLPARFTQMEGWDTYCYVLALILTKQYALGIGRLQTALISLDNLITINSWNWPPSRLVGVLLLFVFESLPV